MKKRDIHDGIMLIDTNFELFDMKEIQNRRFAYSPESKLLVLGRQYPAKIKGVVSSHAEEIAASGTAEPYDNFVRGWVGTGKDCPDGIIHFAPHIPGDTVPSFERGWAVLDVFLKNGASGKTIVRGFGTTWERPMNDVIAD